MTESMTLAVPSRCRATRSSTASPTTCTSNEGGQDAGPNAPEYLMNTARGFGYGSTTDIDLPSEAAGRVPGPGWRQEYWEDNKDFYCNFEKEASARPTQRSLPAAALRRALRRRLSAASR